MTHVVSRIISSFWLLYIFVSIFLLCSKLYFSQPLDFIALVCVILLAPIRRKLFVWPLALGLAFYGKSPSFYQEVPYDTFLLGCIVFELIKHTMGSDYLTRKENVKENVKKDNDAALRYSWFIIILLFCWVVFRSVDSVHDLLIDCKKYGGKECMRDLFLAHTSSEFIGSRTLLTWFISIGLAKIFSTNSYLNLQFLKAFTVSASLVFFAGFRHFINIPRFFELYCNSSYYCNAFFLTFHEMDKKRIISFFGNPGWLGQFTLFALPVFLAFLVHSIKNKKWEFCFLSSIALFLTVANALGSGQRATWLGLVTMILVLTVYFPLKIKKNNYVFKMKHIVFSLGVIVLSTFLTLFFFWSTISPKLTISLSGRGSIWYISYLILKENLFCGVGVGNYLTAFKDMSARIKTNLAMETAHNAIIHQAVETGIVGAFLLFTVMVSLIYILFLRKERNFVFLLMACIGIFVNTLFQEIFYIRTICYLFWILIGMVLVSPKGSPLVDNNRNEILLWVDRSLSLFKTHEIKLKIIVVAFLLFGYLSSLKASSFGCYVKEKDVNGSYYEWCRKESKKIYKNVSGSLLLNIGSLYNETLKVDVFSSENIKLKSELVELRKASESIFEVKAPSSGPTDIQIYFDTINSSPLMNDHRQLSYFIRFPEKRFSIPLEQIEGLYEWETDGNNYWRWASGKAKFVISVSSMCKNPYLEMLVGLPEDLITPEDTIKWRLSTKNTVIDGSFPEKNKILHDGQILKIFMIAGDDNRIEIESSSVFNQFKRENKGDTRDLAVQIRRLVCSPD